VRRGSRGIALSRGALPPRRSVVAPPRRATPPLHRSVAASLHYSAAAPPRRNVSRAVAPAPLLPRATRGCYSLPEQRLSPPCLSAIESLIR